MSINKSISVLGAVLEEAQIVTPEQWQNVLAEHGCSLPGRQGRQPIAATAPPARSALPLVARLCEKLHGVSG